MDRSGNLFDCSFEESLQEFMIMEKSIKNCNLNFYLIETVKPAEAAVPFLLNSHFLFVSFINI
jgi:hypothetical protein